MNTPPPDLLLGGAMVVGAAGVAVLYGVRTLRRGRAQFDRVRDDLVLKLLAAGRAYVCAKDGCPVNHNLHVDHITALSKGGTDDLVNLQFLCGPHNSEKGDR